MSDLVVLSVTGPIATLTLNRPEKLNAFADNMREQLIAALDEVVARGAVRALVLTGAGRAFSAGGDVRHMVGLKQRAADFDELRPLVDAGREVVRKLTALPFPTLAAVNGVAAGAGLNLALACDLRLASDQASFGETFVRIGLHPDWGGSYFLPRLVGTAKALELCWLGDVINAAEALRIGLVQRVVPHPQFPAAVSEWAARLAAAPLASVRLIKQNLCASPTRSLDEGLAAESRAQEDCWNSADAAEGLRAFVEKRAAAFGDGIVGESAPSRAARQFE